MMRLGIRLATTALALALSVPAFAHDHNKHFVTVTGDVVSYEPGHMLVVRGPDSKEVRYTLTSDVMMPSDVAVGRSVTLYTEPGTNGTTVVRRVTMMTEHGLKTRTTTTTTTGSDQMAGDNFTGEVIRFEPSSRMLVLRGTNAGEVTYHFAPDMTIPTGIVVGHRVTVYTTKDDDGTVVVHRVVLP